MDLMTQVFDPFKTSLIGTGIHWLQLLVPQSMPVFISVVLTHWTIKHIRAVFRI